MRPCQAFVALASLSIAVHAQGQRIELINDPANEGIFVEDGVAGLQYVYDVWINSGGAGAFQIGGAQGPLGSAGTFVASESAWHRDPTLDGARAGVWQAWYSSSIGNSCGLFGCEGIDYNDPAGVGIFPIIAWDLNGVHHDGSSGQGPFFTPGAPIPWVRDNIWHTVLDYGSTSEYFFPGPGFGAATTPSEGTAWSTATGVFIGGALGLQATARIVSPYEPGDINWYIDAPTSGATIGPNGAPILHLDADVSSISLASGGAQNLDLYSPPSVFAGQLYLLLGSTSGTSPGTPLGGGITLPLNVDAYTLVVAQFAGGGLYPGAVGTVDADGRANAAVNLPAGLSGAALVGLSLDHAFVTIDLLSAAGPEITGATNAVPLTLLP